MIGRVYNIGDFRVEVKQDYSDVVYSGDKECRHRNLTFDEKGQIVECGDCKKQVTAWWAFLMLTKQYAKMLDKIDSERQTLEEEKKRNLTHKSAILVEDAWRRRKLVPTCPHCTKPILPGDRFGASGVGKPYAHDAKPMEFRGNLEVVAGYKADEGA